MFWRFEDVYNVSVEPIAVPHCSQQMEIFLLFNFFIAPSLKYNLENLVHYTDSTSSRLSRLEFICLELEYDVIITQRLETAQQHNKAACLQ